jgi:hypothetical protein
MLKKSLFILLSIFLLCSLSYSQRQNDIVKSVPYKNLTGVSTMTPGVPADCSGWNVCFLFCSGGMLIVYDFPFACTCTVIQGVVLTIRCPPIGCPSVSVFCRDMFPPNAY